MDGKRLKQLTAWGVKDPAATRTQASLKALWKVSQAAVSNAVTSFIQQGYVIALPRVGGEPIQCVLSGVRRLVFG